LEDWFATKCYGKYFFLILCVQNVSQSLPMPAAVSREKSSIVDIFTLTLNHAQTRVLFIAAFRWSGTIPVPTSVQLAAEWFFRPPNDVRRHECGHDCLWRDTYTHAHTHSWMWIPTKTHKQELFGTADCRKLNWFETKTNETAKRK